MEISTLSDCSEVLLVHHWDIKGPLGSRMGSKRPFLLPFRSYGPKTIIFEQKHQKIAKNGSFLAITPKWQAKSQF